MRPVSQSNFLQIFSQSLVGPFEAKFVLVAGPQPANSPEPDLAYLSILKSDQLLAKVGSVELRTGDLRDALELEFHGQMHSSLSAQDLSLKIAAALDKLIQDELLAQEARKPIFALTTADGAIGGHLQAARDAYGHFENLSTTILRRAGIVS